MKIPSRFAPLLFGAILSAIMVFLVSGFVLALNHGFQPDFVAQWARSCITTWPVAFPTVTLVAPWVRKLVAHMTA